MIPITTGGKVGSAAGRLLAERDVPVRLLVRHPEKAAALGGAGVEVFPADLDSPESIDQAMRGVSSVVLVTSPVLQQELSVIDSAERAGIEHVVKITSEADAHSPITRRRIQSEIEDALVASGLSSEFAQTSKWAGDQLIVISAFWDAAVQRQQARGGPIPVHSEVGPAGHSQ